MNNLLLGTSGFTYPEWKGKFYPSSLAQREWLAFYSKHFNTVEINASYYTALKKSTYEKWYSETPDDFLFAVKGHRLITQLKKLHHVEEPLEKFFESISGLREKLSCILWQFPESFRFEGEKKDEMLFRFERFLSVLPSQFRHAVEFRHISCWDKSVIALLQKVNVASVIADSSVFPRVEVLSADFIYIRFHGPGELYLSSYSDDELLRYAEPIQQYRKRYDVYCYFNNDGSGKAVENAVTLRTLVLKM